MSRFASARRVSLVLAGSLLGVAPIAGAGAQARRLVDTPRPLATAPGDALVAGALRGPPGASGRLSPRIGLGEDASKGARREPIIAGFLGTLPGLGHVYAGEPKRGLVVAGAWFAGGLVAFSSADKAVTSAGAIVLLGSQVFSIADAALAAQRFNKRHAEPRK